MKNIFYKLNSQVGRALLPVSVIGLTLFVTQFAIATVNLTNPNGNVTAPTNAVTGTGDITNLFCGIINWVFWGLLVLAVIMFLVGGYRYATSSGDPEKVGQANKSMLYGAIAVVIALCAWGIPKLVGSILGVNYSTLCP